MMTRPQRPRQISEYAQACLDALASGNLGRHISLGGAFGLAHYFEYRSTHDVDAWWVESISREDQGKVVQVLEEAMRPFGEIRIRSWGDVTSVELAQGKKTIFSFQIARRSAELHPPLPGPWPGGIYVDSFDDLVAGKMTALVERGAPRDFLDIYTLCQHRLCDVEQCWMLWTERQRLSGEDADRQRATLALQTHLARLEQARPLAKISDPEQRAVAEQLRTWFSTEFLHDLPN
jgi:hypothetical protein